jgi:hypothetical protein
MFGVRSLLCYIHGTQSSAVRRVPGGYQQWSLLGLFAVLPKRLLASSCLSVRLYTSNTSATTGRIFIKLDIWFFLTIRWENEHFIKVRITVLDVKPIHIFYHTSLISFRMRNVSDTKYTENQNTHIMFNNFFYEIMWKKCRAGKTTDDNMAHAHCMLDN